jgi:hypothetical protein
MKFAPEPIDSVPFRRDAHLKFNLDSVLVHKGKVASLYLQEARHPCAAVHQARGCVNLNTQETLQAATRHAILVSCEGTETRSLGRLGCN